MSKENVKKFYDALAQDTALAEELGDRIAAVTIEFAAEKGFEFTAEDLTELSDDDLDNVSGGMLPVILLPPASRSGARATGRGASGGW